MNKVKQRTGTKKEGSGKLWAIVLCLLLAGGVFVFLLQMEAKELAKYEKGYVVVAAEDISGNTEITKENIGVLFSLVERPLTDIPEAACLEPESLVGQYVQSDIDAGSMITESMMGKPADDYSDKVLLGVNMVALDQSVAGTLRAGDLIDIYTVDVEQDYEEEEVVLVDRILNGVSVVRSYTGAGDAILKEDETAIAQYIVIPVHSEAVDEFYKALENKKIQIVKHPAS